MEHNYKVGDRVVMAEDHPSYEELNAGDVAKISGLGTVGAHILKNGKEYYTIYSRLIPFREVPPTFPALPEGVQIGDRVHVRGGRSKRWVERTLITITQDGRYVAFDEVEYIWEECRAIPKTITRFKSLGFLISDLERRGYKRKGPDFSIGEHGCGYSVAYLLEKAGARYHNEPNTPANWLEEVPECKP